MRWSGRARPTATSCATRSPRRISPITSCRRTRSSSTIPARTSTRGRPCCRCRTASRWWSARRASPSRNRCFPFRSGTARSTLNLPAELLLQGVVSGLLLGGVYGLVAFGLSLIFGVLRIINFAHGAVMMLAMYTTYWLVALVGIDPYLSILISGPLFFLIGIVVQRAVIEPNRFAAEHNQLLLTLGLALFLENLALVLWQGDYRTVRPAYASASFVVGEALVEVPRLVACGGAIVMAVVLFAFLKLTDVGKAIRALAEEPEGAMLMGINVSRIRAAAFGIGAGAVAVAGALVTPFFYVAPDVGEAFNIMAFVVVVLGGMGNFVGALLGGFIVGLAESLGATLLPGSLKQLVVFALFVLVLLFRPAGLFGGGRGR